MKYGRIVLRINFTHRLRESDFRYDVVNRNLTIVPWHHLTQKSAAIWRVPQLETTAAYYARPGSCGVSQHFSASNEGWPGWVDLGGWLYANRIWKSTKRIKCNESNIDKVAHLLVCAEYPRLSRTFMCADGALQWWRQRWCGLLLLALVMVAELSNDWLRCSLMSACCNAPRFFASLSNLVDRHYSRA